MINLSHGATSIHPHFSVPWLCLAGTSLEHTAAHASGIGRRSPLRNPLDSSTYHPPTTPPPHTPTHPTTKSARDLPLLKVLKIDFFFFFQSRSIHNRGLVGHVEEIAIAQEHQGKGLGLAMLAALDGVGRSVGCYKNILNCGAQNEPFYVKCGYHNSGTEMSRYFDEAKDDYHRG